MGAAGPVCRPHLGRVNSGALGGRGNGGAPGGRGNGAAGGGATVNGKGQRLLGTGGGESVDVRQNRFLRA